MAELKENENEMEIPNALNSFDCIVPSKNHLLLFLDYDGTLSEIVSDTNLAFLSDSMSALLHNLSSLSNVTMTIVTGRSIKKVQSFIANHKNIHFAGNHGLEIALLAFTAITSSWKL